MLICILAGFFPSCMVEHSSYAIVVYDPTHPYRSPSR